MSKKSDLLFWVKRFYRPYSSVEVNDYGSDNFYLRARRTVQDFAVDPKIPVRRIPDDEALLRGLTKKGCAKLAFYEWEDR